MSGWYRMHRGWMQSDDFKPEPFTEREAFLWSIEKAAFEPHSRWFNGNSIPLERGQLVTSIRQMATAFSWTVKRTRGFMERMGKCKKWAQETAHTHCIITICKYEEYQSLDDVKGHTKGQTRGTVRAQSGHSQGTQDKKTQELEEGKEEGEESLVETKAKKRSTSIPDSFIPVLTDAAQAIVAKWPPGMFDRELAQFVDHHTAKGSTMKDWQAAFRTWITNADKWKGSRHGNGSRNADPRDADTWGSSVVRAVARSQGERSASGLG